MNEIYNKRFWALLTALIVLGGALVILMAKATSAPLQQAHAVENEPLVNSTMPVEPVISKPELTSAEPTPVAPEPKPAPAKCNTRENVYCYGTHGVDEYGTPIPTVQETQPAEPWKRDDGYYNYCYLMDDGSWTTVTGKLELGKGIYYYGGSIDPDSQAPAYAKESQQWCASHVPPEAQ